MWSYEYDATVFSKNIPETRHQEDLTVFSKAPSHHKIFLMPWVPGATLHFLTLIALCISGLSCLCPGCRTLSHDTMWLEPFLEQLLAAHEITDVAAVQYLELGG